MKRRTVLSLIGASALSTAFFGSASAQSKMVLKASDVHPLGYPTVEAVTRMGKKLEQATNGRLSIQMFPLHAARRREGGDRAGPGRRSGPRANHVGPVGSIVDDLNVFNMPFVFRDVAHMRKVIDGDIGKELLEKITSNPQTRLVGLCWMDAGSRNVYNSRKPVRSSRISRD